MSRRRLDREMVERGLVRDEDEARRVIEDRAVVVDGAPGLKASSLVEKGSQIRVERSPSFVSRGGDKLHGALIDLGIDISGKRCLDAGAGSGGFTDSLLKAGAKSVLAVDVGYGQFDWTLRTDPRVRLLERTNIRHLLIPGLTASFDVIAADLSFVPLRSVVSTLAKLAAPEAVLLLLVKPQFEVPAKLVGNGGIVSDPATWELAINSVAEGLEEAGFGAVGVAPARIRGAEGNQEFFISAKSGVTTDPDLISTAVKSVS